MISFNGLFDDFVYTVKKILNTNSSLMTQIGNPLLKLDRDAPATYEFFWSHGMISDEIGLTIMNQCDFEDYTFGTPHNVSKLCNDALEKANAIVGDYINEYDVILDVCYPSIMEQELRLRKYVYLSFKLFPESSSFTIKKVVTT